MRLLVVRNDKQLHTFLNRHPLVLGGVMMAFIAIMSILLFSLRAIAADPTEISSSQRMVTIYDQGQEQTIITSAGTVASALKEAGVEMQPVDQAEPSVETELEAKNYRINIYRARPVTVIDGQRRLKVITAEQSPRQIVAASGSELQDEDITKLERVDSVLDGGGAGLELTIDRATPFTFVIFGKRVAAYTQATTFGDMLKEKNITLTQKDGTSAPLSTGIVAGMTIEVWRNGVQTVTQEEDITMPVEQIKDQDKAVGFKEVRTPGKPGKKQVTYEINMQNGVEVSRKVIVEVKTLDPVTQVEVIGAKLPTPANPTEAQALGHQMMLAFGYGEDQWPCLYNLWMKESGWRTTAGNVSSGAYGIPQALPATKMAVYGADYLTNASVQITWGLNYIKGRYATPCGAWSAFQSKGWY